MLCPQKADLFEDPLAAAVAGFVSDADAPPACSADRDAIGMRAACARGRSLMGRVPRVMNRNEVWGGGLRRLVETPMVAPPERGPAYAGTDEDALVDPEGVFYRPPRYVPVGFARYVSPVVDPGDYNFYNLSAWRVAIPRSTCGPEVRNILNRILQYGPQSVGYARIGDTLVPARLGPGDRQTLAETEPRSGPVSRKYPYL